MNIAGLPGLYDQRHLSAVGQAKLDGSGNGTMLFQVGGYEIWDVTGATLTTTQSTSTTPIPTVTFYRGIAIPQNQVSTAYNGARNNFRGSVKLWTGQWLTVTLLAGVAASTATITLDGTILKRIGCWRIRCRWR